jgi:YD repeat-containing protein
LGSRARANVYFANPQDIFRGVQFNYVNVGLGNLTFLRRDLVTSGRIPIVFARVYDSSSLGSSDFGPGWMLSAGETISVENQTASLLNESGSVIEFIKAGDDTFALAKDRPSDYLELRRTSEITLQLKLRTGFTKEFTAIGDRFVLTKVTDRNGNTVHLTYTDRKLSKIENANHFIEIKRDQQGRITSVQDDQGRKVSYQYDAKGRLIETDDLGGAAWLYSYTDDNKLKTAVDPMKRLNFEIAYDDAGRVRRLRQPSGVVQFNHDRSNRSTTVIDRKQLISRYFQNAEGITVRVVNPLGEETGIRLDDPRNVISLARNGILVQSMEYDGYHRITNRHTVNMNGTTDVHYKYDAASGALLSIDSTNGLVRTFAYDANGNLRGAVSDNSLHQYGFSSSGDLTAYSAKGLDLGFAADPDGLIASLKDAKDASTFEYKAGAELAGVTFADGSNARYEYQPSGLRAKLTYNDGRQTRYTYDPAGNLLSTEIFDAKSKQVQGQKLTLNESYQVIKRILFDGTEESFEYDANGNLTKHTKDGAVARFEYDELNRLIAVLTPTGERLKYTYDSGERSIVEQYEHSSILVADLIDSGSTFGNAFQVLATRPVSASFGTIRFSESLGTFQLANAAGNEIISPETTIEQALQKLSLIEHNTPLKRRQNLFNRPFNTIFMPAEYATINCCFSCAVDPSCHTGLVDNSDTSSCCPPCDPPLPTPAPPAPSITSITPTQVPIGTTSQQVTLKGAFNSHPVVTVASGSGITAGAATLDNNGNLLVTFTISSSTTVGQYQVSESDDGGESSTKPIFSIAPRIDSISPPTGLIVTPTQVTISGQGFGSAPTINAGQNLRVSNITVVSDLKVTATFTSANDVNAAGSQNVTITASNVSSANQNFFVQIPSQIQLLSSAVSSKLQSATANGCPEIFLNDNNPGPFGMKLALRYQVLDQQSPGKPIIATMPLHEDLLNAIVDGQPQGSRLDVPVTASGDTDSDGTFIDDPVGGCNATAFTKLTFTQRLFIPLTIQVSPTVRTNNFIQTGMQKCGSSTNSTDINVTVSCN